MKNHNIVLCTLLLISTSCLKEQGKINNLKTFAKAYGYAKYFHPSHEASIIDWNSFAAHGADEISKCKNQAEVINKLNQLFKPIGPGIIFSKTEQKYDLKAITPKNIEDYHSTYWQHKGVNTGMNRQNGIYRSVRVNQYSEVDEASTFGNLTIVIDPQKYKGKEIKYTGWVKLKEGSNGTGHLWLRVDKADDTRGFFDNMNANPIVSTDWMQYEIIGKIDDIATNILIGCFMSGKGTLYLDNVALHYKENNEWIEIPIKNSDFEAEQIGVKNKDSQWSGKSIGYSYKLSSTENKAGERCAVIAYEGKIKKVRGESIFESFPKFGEIIEKEIGVGVFCQIPLNLYGNEEGTYPKSINLSNVQDRLNDIDGNPNELSVRLGNVINTYNVFQHFYPYFDVVDVDWDKELEIALKQSYSYQSENDHLIALQKLTAPLKDGHIQVRGGNRGWHAPPIVWEWIEDQLVITDVLNQSLDLQIGDVVTKVNNLPTEEFFKEVNSRISAGTEGYLNHRAKSSSLLGKEDTELIIEINNKTIALKRDKEYAYGATGIEIQLSDYKYIDENIFYLNLSKVEMDTITKLLPKLEQANGIICDLRGYPNGNHDFISHLLSTKDTSKAWMKVPKIIYPDQENITGYEDHGWEMEPKEPYLGNKKIVFIIDGRAISYAESFMSFIEGYNLATIVGQPTAGTNGNVNSFSLLGNYSISWTGLKVVKHDGSQHHGIGILPDIYVSKTIEGVKSEKDEFLEKAIEVISN